MSASSLPPESWWTREFQPRMEALLQRAVNDLAALVAGSGGTGAPHGPVGMYPIPLDALLVSRLAVAANIPGITDPFILRQVVTAPAYGSVTYTHPVAAGTVMIQIGPFQGNASAHSKDITATVTVDNQRSPIANMPGTADIDTIIPDYAPVRNEITAVFVNGTPNPVDFTVTFHEAIVAESEYDTVWAPLFRADYTLLRTLARALQGTEGS